MILHQGNYWDYYNTADLFLFTGNSTVKPDGRLVMGAGTAKQVKTKFPGIDLALGREILELYPPLNNKDWKREYLLLTSPNFKSNPTKKIGVFQTKYYWKQNASIKLIEKSCFALVRFIQENPNLTIFLPVPGIGQGQLPVSEVLSVLSNVLNPFLPYDKTQPGLRLWVYSRSELESLGYYPGLDIIEC